MNRVDVLLAEHRDLRSEIVRLSTVQHLLLGLNLVLAVAMVPIYVNLRDTGSVALVSVPFVFTIVAWLHVSQDMTIISTARYLHQRLRPAIIDAMAMKTSGRQRCLAGSRTRVRAVPPIASAR